METISNAATAAVDAASKMLWGDNTTNTNTGTNSGLQTTSSGVEPISGVKGAGTVTDPYDGGNKEESNTSTQTEPLSGVKGAGTKSDPYDGGNKEENKTSSLIPETKGSMTGGAAHSRSDSGAQGVKPSDIAEPNVNPNKTSNVGGFGTVEPSIGANPSHAQQPTQKQQGGDRPKDEPSSEQRDAIKSQKDEVDDLVQKRDPNDHSGEPMKMHDGSDKERSSSSLEEEKQKEREEKGTGEKWIKTSGLAADGGDFDAAKAGAGKEADRILETQGVRRESPDKSSPKPSSHQADHSPAAEKTGLAKKLKEKLHIHKH